MTDFVTSGVKSPVSGTSLSLFINQTGKLTDLFEENAEFRMKTLN